MKYSEAKVEEICRFLKKGSTAKNACLLTGISEETYYEWKRSKPEFSESVERAKAEFYNGLVQIIVEAGKTDYKAAEWLLEHRFSEDYSIPYKLDVKKTKEAQKAASEKWLSDFRRQISTDCNEVLREEMLKPMSMSWKDYYKSKGYADEDAEIYGRLTESRAEMLMQMQEVLIKQAIAESNVA
jgi:hypothetical protein